MGWWEDQQLTMQGPGWQQALEEDRKRAEAELTAGQRPVAVRGQRKRITMQGGGQVQDLGTAEELRQLQGRLGLARPGDSQGLQPEPRPVRVEGARGDIPVAAPPETFASYQNPGTFIPGSGQGLPGAEFTPTIAPGRRQEGPPMRQATNDFLSGDVSGMMQRSLGGDAEAARMAFQRNEEDVQRARNAARPTFAPDVFNPMLSPIQQAQMMSMHAGLLDQARDKAETAVRSPLLKAMGLSEDQFKADTERAKAGVMEYQQKVRGPQEDAAAMERQKLQSDTQREIAETGRRSAIEGAFAQEAVRRATDPNATPDERLAARDALREMRDGINRPIKITGDRGQVRIDGGGTQDKAPADKDAFTKMDEAARAGKAQRELIAEATGRTMTPQGMDGKATFDPAKIASAISKREVSPAQLRALVNEIKGGGFGSQDQVTSDLFRGYSRLSGTAGQRAGASPDLPIVRDGGKRTITFQVPGVGQITLPESVGPGRAYSLGDEILGGAITNADRQEAATNAAALARFLREYVTPQP